MKCSLGISNFLEEISSLSLSVVFLCIFALIAKEGFLISPCYSLELRIQMGISFLFSFAFSFSFLFLCKALYDNHFAFLHFFFLSMASKKSSSHLTVAFPWMKVFFFYEPLPCWLRQFLKIPIIPAPTPSIETFMSGACCASCSDLLWRGQIPCSWPTNSFWSLACEQESVPHLSRSCQHHSKILPNAVFSLQWGRG